MIYSPSRFVFIHIPRTAGLSITQAVASRVLDVADMTINLSGIGDLGYWRHTRACEMAGSVPQWESLYRFAVIRSPWEIVESFWRLARAQFSRYDGEPPFPHSARHHWRFLYATARMSFADWIPWHFGYLHGHGGFWRYWCCARDGGDLGVDPIRFERLAEEWPSICDRIGMGGCLPYFGPPELPRVNRTCGNVQWTDETVAAVAELCADDIERFGFRYDGTGRRAAR